MTTNAVIMAARALLRESEELNGDFCGGCGSPKSECDRVEDPHDWCLMGNLRRAFAAHDQARGAS